MTQTKRLFRNIVLAAVLLTCVSVVLTSCGTTERRTARFQRQLTEMQDKAEQTAEHLTQVLQGSSFDSLRVLSAETEDLCFYVFDARNMVYWSDNRLSASHVYLNRYDTWDLVHFDNAWGLCRWSRAGEYNVLTVVPVKYDYPYENRYLRNDFFPPFGLPHGVSVSKQKESGGQPVLDKNGRYLFSLHFPEDGEQQTTDDSQKSAAGSQPSAVSSFSYQSILTKDADAPQPVHRSTHYYLLFTIIFLAALLVLGIVGLVRSRGIRNMKMSVKFQYLIVLLLLVAFGYVFVVSVYYVNSRFEERQSEDLRKKAGYIQKSLQNLYTWNLNLTSRATESLNVELRDLCFAYETDIQVYDMEGNLVGSSSPAIFEQGILSRHIAPEPFFSGNVNCVRQEKIGTMPYLAAYTEFYNGSYVQIGYIEVPYYITQEERRRTLDDFLARLFPPYIAVMVIAVILGLLLSRSLTRPLKSLTEGMSAFRVGQRNAHLHYDGNDEVGALVQEYNRMVDELEESTRRLAKSERESAWRTMARQIAHEINNPLTPMKLNIQQLQRLRQTDDPRFDVFFERSTKMLIEQIDNLSRIASSFSSFAKMPEVHAQKTDVAVLLYSVITLFRSNQQKVPVRYLGAEHGVYANADSEQLPQVFTNLIKNALQALEERADGDIIVILKDLNSTVEITVSDNGPGIAEDVRDKVFVPNFTTKSTGTGLGLAISKNIVEGSGGRIWFDTSQKGTSFFVELKK